MTNVDQFRVRFNRIPNALSMHELNIDHYHSRENARIIVNTTLYNVLCISPESSKRTEHILLLSDHAAAARCVYTAASLNRRIIRI